MVGNDFHIINLSRKVIWTAYDCHEKIDNVSIYVVKCTVNIGTLTIESFTYIYTNILLLRIEQSRKHHLFYHFICCVWFEIMLWWYIYICLDFNCTTWLTKSEINVFVQTTKFQFSFKFRWRDRMQNNANSTYFWANSFLRTHFCFWTFCREPNPMWLRNEKNNVNGAMNVLYFCIN